MAMIDLHFHSNVSDGALSVPAVIRRAAERGATLVALTDHDCTRGLEEACAVARDWKLAFLNGVEISVTWGGGHTIHIIGLGIDPKHPVLAAGLQRIREGRITRARCMAQKLADIGIDGVFDGAMGLCHNPEMIGRTHIARFLVSAGYVKDMQSVFRKFLVPGKPGYVSHEWACLADAVSWIRTSGGVAVIAHPARYEFNALLTEQLIGDFKQAGGEAIEVASASHSVADMHKYAFLAQRYRLLSSSGSDFHTPTDRGNEVGRSTDLPAICQPVWQILNQRIIQ